MVQVTPASKNQQRVPKLSDSFGALPIGADTPASDDAGCELRAIDEASQPEDNTYFDTERPAIVDLVPQSAKTILDVGCGAGWLGAALKRCRPVIVWGIEPSAEAAALARTRLDVVLAQPLETALDTLAHQQFDCIVLADVLEHLIDPWTALERLKRHLAGNGVIVASIPNAAHSTVVRALLDRNWRYEAEGILDRTHLRFFARNTVEELFWNAGLRIASLSTHELRHMEPPRLGQCLARAGFDAREVQADLSVFQFHVVAMVAPTPDPTAVVAVLVLNWNGKTDTIDCLDTVLAQDHPGCFPIVIDNGSTDGSVAAIKGRFPDVEVISVGSNRGYAGGNNVGLRYVLDAHRVDFVLILNNDTVLPKDFVRKLLEVQRVVGPKAILSPQIRDATNPQRIWYAGASWNGMDTTFDVDGANSIANGYDFETIRETAIAVGCAMLFPVSALRDVGLFEERFFLVHEESDWCYRAKRVGYRCFLAPQAKLLHKISVSFGGPSGPLMQYFDQRNRLLFAERNFPPRLLLRALRMSARQALKDSRRVLPPFSPPLRSPHSPRQWYWSLREYISTVRRKPSALVALARVAGIRDYVLRRFGDCPPGIRRINDEWQQRRREGKDVSQRLAS